MPLSSRFDGLSPAAVMATRRIMRDMRSHGYEPRSPQVRALLAAGHHGQNAYFIAGTGSGKGTIAKFLPIVTGKKVIVVTTTISLNMSFGADSVGLSFLRLGFLRSGVQKKSLLQAFQHGDINMLVVLPEYFGDSTVVSVWKNMIKAKSLGAVFFDECDEAVKNKSWRPCFDYACRELSGFSIPKV
mmetsp:Transcript_4439/g.8903  ORF Transcript_4439/g.8903 Transcript_4439/m.8903 type:complete len:186 (-) Transcript_4439:452-1009(-)